MNSINLLKDKIYEFEGLLELASMRPDRRDDLYRLMASRLAEVNELFAGMMPKPEAAPAPAEKGEEETPAAPEPAPEPEPVEKEQVYHRRPRPAFCLNDKFRFNRFLFGGNQHAFDTAMDLVSDMTSYEEAEEYFYGRLAFDPEEPDVSDFMAIIKEYLLG